MSILDLIKRDIADITGNADGFGVALTFQPPTGAAVVVYGTTTKHRIVYAPDGAEVNTKHASCSVAESILVAAGYTVRNADNEVSLRNHKVTFADSAGNIITYNIEEAWPDEKIGLIVCKLGETE